MKLVLMVLVRFEKFCKNFKYRNEAIGLKLAFPNLNEAIQLSNHVLKSVEAREG